MRAFVYILKSESGRYYIGSTVSLVSRMRQHRRGYTATTKRMGQLEMVFKQEFSTLKQAREIERKLKSWKRKDFIEKIIKDGIMKTGIGSIG